MLTFAFPQAYYALRFSYWARTNCYVLRHYIYTHII